MDINDLTYEEMYDKLDETDKLMIFTEICCDYPDMDIDDFEDSDYVEECLMSVPSYMENYLRYI